MISRRIENNLLFISICLMFGITSCQDKTKISDSTATPGKPNIIVIIADDLGYGDLSCQGHPLISTPHLDRLAAEGQRYTSFYAASSVCGPSRAALLTGRLPYRIHKGKRLWADVPTTEYTIAEMLKGEGYATACIGKWGIGWNEGQKPNDQGFDFFYGLSGSNDGPFRNPKEFKRTLENVRHSTFLDYDIQLYRQDEIIEDTVRQDLLTKSYTEQSVEWIKKQSGQPFFLYLAYSMPHVPIFPSAAFQGHSKAGRYGDTVEEIDWSVGEIIKSLRALNLENNTLVVFTSDNGPWLTYYDQGGSPGPFRDGKMTSWEGGFRVPGIFWWPGKISPGVVDDIVGNVDLMATVASMVGAQLPSDRHYDSYDISGTLLHGEPGLRKEWFYYVESFGQYPDNLLWAARVGDYKLHYSSWESVGSEVVGFRGLGNKTDYQSPVLFNLRNDIMERHNIADQYPDVVRQIDEAVARNNSSILSDR